MVGGIQRAGFVVVDHGRVNLRTHLAPVNVAWSLRSAVMGEPFAKEGFIGEALTGEALTGEALTGEALTGDGGWRPMTR